MVRDIKMNVEGFFAGRERYAHLGLPHRRGFLFAGPPGCGKTFTLKALAFNTPAKFISVQGTADVNDAMLCRALELAEDCTRRLSCWRISIGWSKPKVSRCHIV